jgi:hypothetical protein
VPAWESDPIERVVAALLDASTRQTLTQATIAIDRRLASPGGRDRQAVLPLTGRLMDGGLGMPTSKDELGRTAEVGTLPARTHLLHMCHRGVPVAAAFPIQLGHVGRPRS